MIAVIADDLAGAAEVAGVAHARGLSAEVCTQTGLVGDADLAAVDSDTRSLPADEAGTYASGLILSKAVLFLPTFVTVMAFPALARRAVGDAKPERGLEPLTYRLQGGCSTN